MGEKVFLTGISGWIAKHTAIELLNSGYEVLGTVRNNNLIEQTKETLSKYASIDKLSFVELDLLKDDGWNEAAKGCKSIMHVASPFPMKVSWNRESLLPPAVDGTLRVLKAGYCTILFNAFLIEKITTMKVKGGNTDSIYNNNSNRLDFAESLKEQHPDVVDVTWKFNRWHHHVNYRPFKKNMLKLILSLKYKAN